MHTERSSVCVGAEASSTREKYARLFVVYIISVIKLRCGGIYLQESISLGSILEVHSPEFPTLLPNIHEERLPISPSSPDFFMRLLSLLRELLPLSRR
jgi:hypothetical protein